MKISEKKHFFLMSKGSFNPKTVAHSQTDGHTDIVTTEGTLSGFQDLFLSSRIGSKEMRK